MSKDPDASEKTALNDFRHIVGGTGHPLKRYAVRSADRQKTQSGFA